MTRSIFLTLILFTNMVLAQTKLPVLQDETFTDNAANWPTSTMAVIENGVYKLTGNNNNYNYVEPTHCINGYNDFVIESSFEVLASTTTLNYGIFWGDKYGNGCFFGINEQGSFTINKHYNTTQTFQEGNTMAITTGVGARNVLRIVRTKGKMNFYINNTLVFTGDFIHNYCSNGFRITGSGQIAIDYFKVLQKAEPIQTASEFPATLVKEKMGDQINSVHEDMNPLISPDGKILFLTRQQHPGNTGTNKSLDDIWFSELNSDTWSAARNAGAPLNSGDMNNDVFSITADNNTLLLNNIYPSGSRKASTGFSFATRTATGWSDPEPILIPDYYNDDPFGEACLSANNKVLIFSVNRKDSRGGRDLYACFLQNDDSWSSPLNLGIDVNSFSDESGPFLAADGKTLYFASSSWPGYGNRDLFVSKRLDDTWTRWSTPLNLGPAINTPNFEGLFRIVGSGEYAVMTSYNPETKSDIYIIRLRDPLPVATQLTDNIKTETAAVVVKQKAPVALPDPIAFIHGKVLNAKTLQPVVAKISYEALSSGEEVGIATSNPANGVYKIVLPYGKNYGFHAKASGYISVNENLDLTMTQPHQEINYDLYLVPLEVGQTIKLNNVFFVRGKPQLLTDSYPELDRLYEIMKENTTLEIALAGHTDNQGDQKLNLNLSEQRVLSVKQYLVSKGIGEKRIAGKGYGSSKPIADNSKEETRRLNRRVEFTITKK
ncbi:MAG: OmpA family protein [Cyclobacteriaceae bacterium]|nr:OmpA family protein [Cyclobacteriaceae bacterium]